MVIQLFISNINHIADDTDPVIRNSDDQPICIPRRGAAAILIISTGIMLFGIVLIIYLLKIIRRPVHTFGNFTKKR